MNPFGTSTHQKILNSLKHAPFALPYLANIQGQTQNNTVKAQCQHSDGDLNICPLELYTKHEYDPYEIMIHAILEKQTGTDPNFYPMKKFSTISELDWKQIGDDHQTYFKSVCRLKVPYVNLVRTRNFPTDYTFQRRLNESLRLADDLFRFHLNFYQVDPNSDFPFALIYSMKTQVLGSVGFSIRERPLKNQDKPNDYQILIPEPVLKIPTNQPIQNKQTTLPPKKRKLNWS